MRRSILALTVALLLVQPAAAQERPVALMGATIIDGSGRPAVREGVLLLHKGRIVAAGPRSAVRLPPETEKRDVSGKWITPGLIDAHVHFFQSGGLYTRPDALDLTSIVPYAQDISRTKARLDETFARYLASGVTAVVDAGGPMWNFEVARRAAAAPRAPRVAVAGPLIATEPTPQQAKLDLGDPPIISASGPDEARLLAAKQLAHKPAFIKIWGIGSGPQGAARVEQITRAVADVAHRARTRVAVHATELETARAAVRGGADILVHSVEDAPLPEDFVRQLKERDVVYVTTAMVHEGYKDAFLGRPTLTAMERRVGAPDVIASLYEAPARVVERTSAALLPDALPQILQNVKRLVDAGVRVAAGTDAGNIGTLHGPALHRELQLLRAAGLTPMQVLTAATRDSAYAYSAKPDLGLLAPGYAADLLVLDANPLDDIANLQRLRTVWVRGTAIDPASLLTPSPEAVVQLQLERYNAHDIEGLSPPMPTT